MYGGFGCREIFDGEGRVIVAVKCRGKKNPGSSPASYLGEEQSGQHDANVRTKNNHFLKFG